MFSELGTTANRNREIAMPNTGDHVIGSPLNRMMQGGQNEIEKFMKQVLKLKKAQ